MKDIHFQRESAKNAKKWMKKIHLKVQLGEFPLSNKEKIWKKKREKILKSIIAGWGGGRGKADHKELRPGMSSDSSTAILQINNTGGKTFKF